MLVLDGLTAPSHELTTGIPVLLTKTKTCLPAPLHLWVFTVGFFLSYSISFLATSHAHTLQRGSAPVHMTGNEPSGVSSCWYILRGLRLKLPRPGPKLAQGFPGCLRHSSPLPGGHRCRPRSTNFLKKHKLDVLSSTYTSGPRHPLLRTVEVRENAVLRRNKMHQPIGSQRTTVILVGQFDKNIQGH